MSSGNPQQQAKALLASGDLCLLELWFLYWGQGGNAGPLELDAFIHGIPLLAQNDTAILGWALEMLPSD